jgi:hypothetical protein
MREAEIIQRLKYFLKDLSDSIKPLDNADDKTHFIKSLKELQQSMYKDIDLTFDEEDFIAERLLEKFRHKMKPFVSSKLHYYFSTEEIYQEEVNKKWQTDPPVILDTEEFLEFYLRTNLILESIKTNFYLTESNQPTYTSAEIEQLAEQKTLKGNFKLSTNEFTRSRQALAMHYLFKSIGISPRHDINLNGLAKFAHLLSAMPYEDINNSSIYESMKELFKRKNESLLIEDLIFVKKHFHFVKHSAAVELIDKEIASLEEKMKSQK